MASTHANNFTRTVSEDARGYVEMSNMSKKDLSGLPPTQTFGLGHERLCTASSTGSSLSLLRRTSASTTSGQVSAETYVNDGAVADTEIRETSNPNAKTDMAGSEHYTNSSVMPSTQKYPSIDEDDGTSHYAFIKPGTGISSTRGSTLRHATNVLYGERKPSSSGAKDALQENSPHIEFSSRPLQLLVIFVLILSVSALGLGVFILLRKSNDCSCPASSNSLTSPTADSVFAPKTAVLTEKVEGLANMVAALSKSAAAKISVTNALQQSVDEKVSSFLKLDQSQSQKFAVMNKSIISTSDGLVAQVNHQRSLIDQLQAGEAQIAQQTNMQSSNVSSSTAILQGLTFPTLSAMRGLTAAVENGYLFDNCTVHSTSCEIRQNADGSQTRATCRSRPASGVRVLGAFCHVYNNNTAYGTLQQQVIGGSSPPENEFICHCRFLGQEAAPVVTSCGVTLYTCHSAS